MEFIYDTKRIMANYCHSGQRWYCQDDEFELYRPRYRPATFPSHAHRHIGILVIQWWRRWVSDNLDYNRWKWRRFTKLLFHFGKIHGYWCFSEQYSTISKRHCYMDWRWHLGGVLVRRYNWIHGFEWRSYPLSRQRHEYRVWSLPAHRRAPERDNLSETIVTL